MTNFELFDKFLNSFNISPKTFERGLSQLSVNSQDKQNPVYVYDVNQTPINALSFDDFCDVYRDKYFSKQEQQDLTSHCSDLNLASVDAFLIDKDENWYLIEFKDSSFHNVKDSVEKKAYQNFFWLCDLFYRTKNSNKRPSFDYDNPIRFAREKITYILVVSEEKNLDDVDTITGVYDSQEKFRNLCMEKLRHYLFKDAYIYTSGLFETYFVKKFQYK